MRTSHKIIIFWMMGVFTLIGVFPQSVFADNSSGSSRTFPYAKGELIVKFKPEAARVVYQALQDGFSSVDSAMSSLDQINAKYEVSDMRRVFSSLETRDSAGNLLAVKSARDVAREINDKFHKVSDLDVSRIPSLEDIYVVTLSEDKNVMDVVEDYRKNPYVIYAEPNVLYHPYYIPNDPEFGMQWNLHNTGQSGGRIDADIDAPEAWELFFSPEQIGNNVIVAVLDSGIYYANEEVRDNIWINRGELPGFDENGDGNISTDELIANGITDRDDDDNNYVGPEDLFGSFIEDGVDTDGNGYVDDFIGWDIWHDNNNPSERFTYSHGALVAATIASGSNNGTSTTGISWHSKIMGVKIFGDPGEGVTTADIVSEATYFAVNNGAQIINMSFGTLDPENYFPVSSRLHEESLEYAVEFGVVLIAAAGNDMSNSKFYPAAYADVIAVANVDHNDEPAATTNYGDHLEIAAPGDGMYILESYFGGTSAASPHVSGVAALAVSYFGDELGDGVKKVERVRQLLVNGSDSLDANIDIGRGRLNTFNTLSLDPHDLPMSRILSPRSQFTMGRGIVQVTGIALGETYTLSLIDRLSGDKTTLVENASANIDGGILGSFNANNFQNHFDYQLELTVQGRLEGQMAEFISYIGLDPYCGNHELNEGEQCDDGNLLDGDGCSASCEIETLTGNQLRNSSFEIDSGMDYFPLRIDDDASAQNEMADGWNHSGSAGMVSGEEAYDGNQYMSFHFSGNTEHRDFGQIIQIEAEKIYRVSGYVKVASQYTRASIETKCLNGEFEEIDCGLSFVGAQVSSSVWTYVTFNVIAESEQAEYIYVGGWAKGTEPAGDPINHRVSFDAFSIREITIKEMYVTSFKKPLPCQQN